jgi:carotenoid cleavage dioxygenase-like enzyme
MPRAKKYWAEALASPAKEFPLTGLEILYGKIPEQLDGGSLYRNGPGRLQRGEARVGHWFDGDGAILAVHFAQGAAKATYRYVQTKGYLAESQADRYLYPNYGMKLTGALWRNWGKEVKNSANTSVMALPDRLLALWEAGSPYALDLENLQTKGIDQLNGTLKNKQPYSAHPKVDFSSGEIYNFGLVYGIRSSLNLYRSNKLGQIIKKSQIPLMGNPPLIHDFVLAGPYLVFFIPPVTIELWPVLLGVSTFSDSMRWQPEQGTQILIIERETLNLVAKGVTEPFFQWHFSNGYLTDAGHLVIEMVRYEDFKTNEYLQQVPTGSTSTLAKSTLSRVILDPANAKVLAIEELLERQCDFPVVPALQVGKRWQHTYLSLQRNDEQASEEILNTIGRFKQDTGELSVADLGEDAYASEAIHVEPNYLLTVVYKGETNSSEVQIFNSNGLEHGPVCRLALPQVIPPGFHGCWRSRTA